MHVAAATANGWARRPQRTGELRANLAVRGIAYSVKSL